MNYTADLRVNEYKLQMDAYQLQVKQLLNREALADRAVLVFLHDSLGCISLWRDFPDQLAAATHCSAMIYDRRGYGRSSPFAPGCRTLRYLEEEAELLGEVLEKCGIRQAILFGHSDGGSIALIAAALYPTMIRGIITEGAHIFVEEITLEGIREAVEAYHTSSLGQRLEKYHGKNTHPVFRAWTETWLRPDFRQWNIESYLSQISCPVLAIQGEKDEYGSEMQLKAITEKVSGPVTLLMLPQLGHSPHKEDALKVLPATAAFIKNIIYREEV